MCVCGGARPWLWGTPEQGRPCPVPVSSPSASSSGTSVPSFTVIFRGVFSPSPSWREKYRMVSRPFLCSVKRAFVGEHLPASCRLKFSSVLSALIKATSSYPNGVFWGCQFGGVESTEACHLLVCVLCGWSAPRRANRL